MSDNIVPTSGPQNDDRPPATIVPRATPVFANSEPVAEVSFAELWRILRKRMWIVAAATCGLFALGLAYCLISHAEIRVDLDHSIQQRELRLSHAWGYPCDAQ